MIEELIGGAVILILVGALAKFFNDKVNKMGEETQKKISAIEKALAGKTDTSSCLQVHQSLETIRQQRHDTIDKRLQQGDANFTLLLKEQAEQGKILARLDERIGFMFEQHKNEKSKS